MGSKDFWERFFACRFDRPGIAWLGIRVFTMLFGLAVTATGILLTVNTTWGVGPWDVLHKAVARMTAIQYGTVQQLTGCVVLVFAVLLGGKKYVRLGTILNMVMIGQYIKWFSAWGLFPRASGWWGIAQLLLGISVNGLGLAIYIRAEVGTGPRDSMLLTLVEKTRGPVWLVKSLLDGTAFTAGLLLKGPAGPGTLIYVLLLGPSLHFFLGVVERLRAKVLKKFPGNRYFFEPAGSGRVTQSQSSLNT